MLSTQPGAVAKERDRPLIYMRRMGAGLEPWSQHDADLLEELGGGVKLRCEVWQARSSPQNRFYWAVLKGVCLATGRWRNADLLHKALKLQLGFVDAIEKIDGSIHLEARSTGFNAMPQAEWEAFMDAAYEVILAEVLPGCTKDDIFAVGTGALAPDDLPGRKA